jgi:hypothetical protein
MGFGRFEITDSGHLRHEIDDSQVRRQRKGRAVAKSGLAPNKGKTCREVAELRVIPSQDGGKNCPMRDDPEIDFVSNAG